jgi:DNA-binding transcriptional regulator YdaS (Cro superfamily)
MRKKTALAKYLEDRGETQGEFADRCGLPPSVVSRLVRGVGDTSGRYWVKIRHATRGKVRPELYYPIQS